MTVPSAALVVVDATTIRTDMGLHDLAHQEWRALIDWCRVHGMNPDDMPVDQVIVRDLERCRVVYDLIVRDGQGKRVLERGDPDDPATWRYERRRVHAQGETPPMPFPDVILRHLDPTRETA